MMPEPDYYLPGPGFRLNPEWRRWWDERCQAAQMRKGEILAAIERVAREDSWAAAVLGHHSSSDDDRRYCDGCDMGCSCEAASWPCSTVVLVLHHYGVDTTDIGLIDWKGEL